MKRAPEFTCPHIARLELFLIDKISTEDLKRVENTLDIIRNINYDLRQYGHYWRRKQQKSRPKRLMKRPSKQLLKVRH